MSAELSRHDATVSAKEAIDGARVDARARELSYRITGDSYKGINRGKFKGTAAGLFVGMLVGAAACLIPGIGLAMLGTALLAGAATGALIGYHEFEVIGSAAASRAAALAEKHARLNDPVNQGSALEALNDRLMHDGRGYHYEFPPGRDKNNTYFWRSGLAGAAIGGGVAGLAGLAGAAHLTSAIHVLPLLGAMNPALALAAVGAAFGATLGVDRKFFKNFLNKTDECVNDKRAITVKGSDKGLQQTTAKGYAHEEVQEMRLQRQEEISHLTKAYEQRIFENAVDGWKRGSIGGAVSGATLGVVVGGVGATIAAIASGGLALPAIAGYLAMGGATGALLNRKIYGDAGMEAGAESMRMAIDEEFERNRIYKQNGINPPKSQPSEAPFINPKGAMIAGAAGLAIGALAGPLLGAAAATFFGLQTATTAATAAITAVIGGTLGATMGGIGSQTSKIGFKALDKFFNKTYYRTEGDPKPKQYSKAVLQDMPELGNIPAVPVHLEPISSKTALDTTPSISAEDMAMLNARLEEKPSQGFTQALAQQQRQGAGGQVPSVGLS